MKTYAETKQDLAIRKKTNSELVITYKGESSDEFSPLVDAIVEIPNKDKKAYIMLKGADTLPASLDDIARLMHIRKTNIANKHKNWRYFIFCERDGNKQTEDIARSFNIPYISRSIDLDTKLFEYFDGK